MKIKEHFKTIVAHRRLVREGCFRVGLYYQGLTHDLSKFMPSEFIVGAKYYQGYRSPNNAEREAIGYSSAWLHHKGRNKHHYEYWLDYSAAEGLGIVPARMPNKYIVEMFMDRVAASKIYNKDNYTQDMPLQYYEKGKKQHIMEKNTQQILEYLLKLLAEEGEEACDEFIRRRMLKGNIGAKIAGIIQKKKKHG